jgi:excisionase family DNA binding protein
MSNTRRPPLPPQVAPDRAASGTPSRPPTSPLRHLLTVGDVAGILNLHPRSIRRLIADGRLPVVRLPRAVRVRPEVVEELIASGGQVMSKDD